MENNTATWITPGLKVDAIKDGERYSAGQQYFIHEVSETSTLLHWAGWENLRDIRISRMEAETNFKESVFQR